MCVCSTCVPQGDEGSPLVSQVENKWYAVGMHSWSRGCAEPDYPAVFTRISAVEDWIGDVLNGNYTEGKYFILETLRFLCLNERNISLAQFAQLFSLAKTLQQSGT